MLPLNQVAIELFAHSLETLHGGGSLYSIPFQRRNLTLKRWSLHILLFKPVRGNVVTVPRLDLRWAGLRFVGGASDD